MIEGLLLSEAPTQIYGRLTQRHPITMRLITKEIKVTLHHH
jgi:hypothetical protein